MEGHSTGLKVETYVTDAAGHLRHSFSPPQNILMTLQEILTVAGVSLDDHLIRTQDAGHLSAAKLATLPYLRMRGAELLVLMDFANIGRENLPADEPLPTSFWTNSHEAQHIVTYV